MSTYTLNLLVAIRDSDFDRLSDARQAWMRAGCPDVGHDAPPPTGRSFGERLEHWRDRRNYSLRALSDRAKIGCTRLFRIESGSHPTLGEWYRLRKALGIVQEEEVKAMERLVEFAVVPDVTGPEETPPRRGSKIRGRP